MSLGALVGSLEPQLEARLGVDSPGQGRQGKAKWHCPPSASVSLPLGPCTASPLDAGAHPLALSRQAPKMGIMVSTRDTDTKLVTAFSANVIPFY